MIHKSPAVLSKIAHTHDGITAEEVDEAGVLTPVEQSWWEHDENRGWRLFVVGTTARARRLLLVLYPVDESDGVWNLGTAIRDD